MYRPPDEMAGLSGTRAELTGSKTSSGSGVFLEGVFIPEGAGSREQLQLFVRAFMGTAHPEGVDPPEYLALVQRECEKRRAAQAQKKAVRQAQKLVT